MLDSEASGGGRMEEEELCGTPGLDFVHQPAPHSLTGVR